MMAADAAAAAPAGGSAGEGWSIEDEYSFDLARPPSRPQVVALVDAHCGMGRPLCEDSVLREAIFDEVCREVQRSSSLGSPWSFLGAPAKVDKDDLRARAATMTAAVLSGDRQPPGRLRRLIDAVGQALQGFSRARDVEVACLLFGDTDDPAGVGTMMPERVPPSSLPAVWEASKGSLGLPSFMPVFQEALRRPAAAAAIVVLTTRAVPDSAIAIEQLGAGGPPVTWVHCTGDPPVDVEVIRGLCAARGGTAATAQSDGELEAALGLIPLPGSPGRGGAHQASALHAAHSAALGSPPPAVQPEASPSSSPASLAGNFFAAALAASAPLFAAVGAGVAVAATASTGSVQAGPAQAAAPSSVIEAVLARHEDELALLAPAARRARIRELVAAEVGGRRGVAAASLRARGVEVVKASVGKALNAERSVDQRLLLEWLLVLNRVIVLCGDAQTLAHACCVSKLWQQALRCESSALALRVWKWVVRFGCPLPPQRRWDFWCSLQGRRQPHVRARVSEYAKQLEAGRSGEHLAEARAVIAADVPRTFAGLVGGGRGDADGATSQGNSSALLPDFAPSLASQMRPLDERRAALERVLLAVAAQCPSVGYCQGLDVLTAFVLSVVEESGRRGDTAEAEAFALISGLLELEHLCSWMEPPLLGLRTASAALGQMLPQRLPELAEHLASEGAGVELLCLSWLQTLFAAFSPMPRATLCRIWECWLLDGTPKVFFRVALALFAQAEQVLLGEPLERVSEVLRAFPPPLDAGLTQDKLIPAAWATKVTNSGLRVALPAAESRMQMLAESDRAPWHMSRPKVEEAELVMCRPSPEGSPRAAVDGEELM